MRLIDADVLCEILAERARRYLNEDEYTVEVIKEDMRYVNRMPTIKAEPVRYGRWLWDGKHHYCSVCSGTRYHDLVLGMDAAYCSYCGAKLDGETDESLM